MNVFMFRISQVAFALFIYLLNVQFSSAQLAPTKIPPSPTSTQFQRYGDYPVSYYTGIPDIKIPIYTIQEGDITVPIYLSYHSGGSRPDDLPSSVGFGWTLNTGGMISRVINGQPDETGSFLGMPDFVRMSKDEFYTTNTYYDLKYFEENKADHEFDIYSYNFLGKSGKFISTPDPNYVGNWKPFLLQQNGLKFNGLHHILDENGISYIFGTLSEYTEETNYYVGASPRSAVSTWHLGSISSSRYPGKSVSYEYQDAIYYQYGRSSDQYLLDDYYDTNKYQYDDVPYANGEVFGSYTNFYSRAKLPKRINFSSGFILFNLNYSKLLESIQIFDNSGNLLKTVSLNLSNFPSTPVISKLQSITFKNAIGENEETYSFNYFNENVTSALVLGGGQDHWGFYNGMPATGNNLHSYSNYITSFGNTTIGSGASKEPNEGATKAYTLNRISHPTGGYTLFDFESNRNSNNQIVGGLRIKSITDFLENNQPANVKTYVYTAGYQEVVPGRDLYVHHGTSVTFFECSARRTIMNDHSQVGISPKGCPIGYRIVKESNGEYSTEYHFDDGAAYSYRQMNYPGYQLIYSDFKLFADEYKPWNYGNLLSKEIRGPGFGYLETNDYEEVLLDTARDVIIDRTIFTACVPNGGCLPGDQVERNMHASGGFKDRSIFNVANRYHLSGLKRLKYKSINRLDANSNWIEAKTEFYYCNPLYPTQVSEKRILNSKGDSLKTSFRYAYDYPGLTPYSAMVMSNRIGQAIEQIDSNVTQNIELSKMRTNYDYFNPSGSSSGIIQAKSIEKSWLTAPLQTELIANRYDGKGHVIQETGKDGLVTSYIYGYESNYLVARVVGADYITASGLINPVIYNSFTTTDVAMRNHLSLLRTGLPDALVTTYTYKPVVGMLTETDSKGKTICYEYDHYQRVKLIKDHNGHIVKEYDYHYKQ